MHVFAAARTSDVLGRYTPRSVRLPSKLRFAGALDAFTVPNVQREIEEVAKAKPREVILDFTQLERIDAVGVKAIMSLQKWVAANGGRVVVVGAKDQPRMVLEVLRLGAVFCL